MGRYQAAYVRLFQRPNFRPAALRCAAHKATPFHRRGKAGSSALGVSQPASCVFTQRPQAPRKAGLSHCRATSAVGGAADRRRIPRAGCKSTECPRRAIGPDKDHRLRRSPRPRRARRNRTQPYGEMRSILCPAPRGTPLVREISPPPAEVSPSLRVGESRIVAARSAEPVDE